MPRVPPHMRIAPLLLLSLSASARLAAQSLPLGDGHVTDHAAVGNVYSCQATFRGGGARHDGPWFHGDHWNPLEKPHVSGQVMWPEAAMTITVTNGVLQVRGNGLPIAEPTGRFPILPSDSVYRYDTNPNAIAAQQLAFEIPASPSAAASPTCLPMGMVGFTTTGVALYNALDDAGRDAAAHEIQDLCDGHPQGVGQYHYHSSSPCLPGADADSLVGWALDGFPILGMRDTAGRLLTNADLDACHGRAESREIDGRHYAYAYHLTREYPYTIGCFTGSVSRETIRGVHTGSRSRRPGQRPG